MTATAAHILEEFRQLAPAEKREVLATITQEVAAPSVPPGQPRKTIADLPAFRPVLDMSDLKPHDRWFAEAIMASKGIR